MFRPLLVFRLESSFFSDFEGKGDLFLGGVSCNLGRTVVLELVVPRDGTL